jgi:hypothetical protein
MKRILLLLMTLVLAVSGAKAAITISSASVKVGNTTYQGYCISGAQEGEIAQFLNGSASVSGVSPEQLKSAEYIKVGSSSSPNVLGDADLAAFEKLSAAKYLDIDGSTLATGANIASIKAGPAIEAVTLPNGLSKADVNAAGAALTACNSNFGSCLSLNAEMETVQKTFYPYTIGGVEYNYTGDLSALTDNGDGTYTYNVTSIERDLSNAEGYPVLTYKNTDLNYMAFTTNEGEIVMTDMGGWQRKDVKVSKFGVKVQGSAGSYYYVNPFTGDNVPIADESNIQTAQGNTFIIVDFSPDYKTYPMEGNGRFKYQYTNLAGETVFTDESTTPDDDMKITLPCNETVTITPETRTITQPKEGGDCEAIAYVNKAGTLYKATSLDSNDVLSVTDVVISGNINNGDISQGGYSGNSSDDPQYAKGDTDKYESNGAIPAFAFNSSSAPIKSVDIGDAVIDDYKHLRALSSCTTKLKSVVFPKTLDKIPNYCCYSSGIGEGCCNLSNVVFPTKSTTLTIGDYAFHHTAIKSLLLPSSVTGVGDNAFATCPELYDVEMEGLDDKCTFGNYVFSQCPALQHVTLSEGVQNIGDYMFNQCGLLESIRIPSTCKEIGSYAFRFCFSIHQITIPEGVELIKLYAFEGAGLTDIYVMASTPASVPKIYAMAPDDNGNGGPSTFSYQRTTGNNTVPQYHRGDMRNAEYDEVMTWYQEEQSGAEGLGTGNCLTALHYPESMKPFYEAIDVSKFYKNGELDDVVNWKTKEQYLNLLEGDRKTYVEHELNNLTLDTNSQAYDFGVDKEGNPILYEYLPQAYAVNPYVTMGHQDDPMGPDKDGRYYPNQHDYWVRMVAGATGSQSGGTENVASQWGWRQFPLSSSIESIGETPFEKEYDDTWYTMAFPWRMIDNQLFSAFNQKMEIVEFVGAELLEDETSSTETVKKYNLVFHFDEVADTYYMDDNDVEYSRERDGERLDAAGHKLYVYTNKKTGDVIQAPDPLPDKNTTDPDIKEAYGRYLNIQNVMVVAGHPYMIHPSIGAAPGNPATVYINGVKKIAVGEGKQYASYEALAEANKVSKTVSSRTRTKKDEDGNITYEYSGPEVWTNPDTGASGGQYYFIGNINDEVKTVDETSGEETSDHGAQDMPLPSYFLGVIEGQKYPKYYKKTKGGEGKWSQYSAIIRPDGTALANVESLYLNKVNSPTGGLAKGANIELGAWDFDDSHIINEHAITTIIEEALEKDPATPIVHMNVVYNIKGEMVRSDSSSIEGLPKGIYIVNGKKYLVK